MVFCGQCGLLIPPGSVKCPRCGTPVEDAAAPLQTDGSDTNAETQASMQALPLRQPGDYPSAHSERTQQYDATYENYPHNNPSTRLTQDSTRNAPAYPQIPHTSSPYNPVTPVQQPYGTGTGFQQQGGYNNYAPQSHPSYPGYQGQPSPTPPPRRGNGLLVTLIIVTLIVVLLAISVLAVGPDKFFPSSTANNGVTPTTQVEETPTDQPTETETPEATATPEETATAQPTETPQATATPSITADQAIAKVQEYYQYINAKQYQQAYDIWANSPQTYEDFKNGFSTTDKDTITSSSASPDANGSFKVTLTLQATTTDGQTTNYNGYYIVAQQPDGSLKFTDGHMTKAS